MAKPPEQIQFTNLDWAPLEFKNTSSQSPAKVTAATEVNDSPAIIKSTAATEVESSPAPKKARSSSVAKSLEKSEAQKLEVTKSEPQVLSVYELNRQIKSILENQFKLVWVQAEISNFKAHTSGHYYFSLKDSKSQITAVMFKGFNAQLKFRPEDGMEVLVRAKVSVYEPRGNYQLFVETMEPVGAGALQKAFEQLKVKLQSEGLFDKQKKRPLPNFPKHIVIVTSPTGAAIRDMLNVLGRRYRVAQITLIPCKVQGDEAPGEIVQAIQMAQKLSDADVMIVGRGGGSIEDLWAFNEEIVARAIAGSRIPTISAVGHEIDFTIADFVADLRAPTPSAAAELVAKNADEMLENLKQKNRHLFLQWQKYWQMWRQQVQHLAKSLVDPARKFQDMSLRNDELRSRLDLNIQRYLSDQKQSIAHLVLRLGNPSSRIREKSAQLKQFESKLNWSIQKNMQKANFKLKQNMSLLDSLSPLKVLDRGYSIVQKQDQQIISSSKSVEVSEIIEIRLAEGRIQTEVKKILE